MLPRKSLALNAISLAVVFLTAVLPLRSQTVDLDKDRKQLVKITGLWRFQTGDDPRWADPGFNDSSWELLRSDQGWAGQGHAGYSGFAWYRFKVNVPATYHDCAIEIPFIYSAYEIFADGKLIGGVGGLPPRRKLFVKHAAKVYAIPLRTPGSQSSVQIAIRVWHWNRYRSVSGGPTGASYVGTAEEISLDRREMLIHLLWAQLGDGCLLLGDLIAALATFALFALRRTDREYLWFALFELFALLLLCLSFVQVFVGVEFYAHLLLSDLLWSLAALSFLNFIRSVVKWDRDRWYWLAVISGGAPIVYAPLVFSEKVSLLTVQSLLLAGLPFDVIVLLVVIRAARKKIPDGRILLAPISLSLMVDIATCVIFIAFEAGVDIRNLAWFSELTEWPFPISLQTLSNFTLQVGVLAILLGRFARTRQHEQRLTNELESARAVQSVLIPTEIPSVPGFAISAVYKPATQVGGDLFQILPIQAGGVLVVIGDVSGKGMPAAMTVSLLVGTIRSLAHYTQSPGEILASMNLRMLARSSGGFTTCLALRVDADGNMTVANAGHISPYLNGAELNIENGLPLGLSAETTYEESTFQLTLNAQLTLMTDGVVEARSRTGELFGFERASDIARGTAEETARTAQEFGQEDDITVVTLTRRSEGPRLVQVPTSAVSEEFA